MEPSKTAVLYIHSWQSSSYARSWIHLDRWMDATHRKWWLSACYVTLIPRSFFSFLKIPTICWHRPKVRNGTDYPSSNFRGIMNSSRNSFEMVFCSRFIILQSVVTRYLFVQKVVNCCIVKAKLKRKIDEKLYETLKTICDAENIDLDSYLTE